MAFGGAKVALLCGARIVVLRRDDDPAIAYPGLIDLPGGGREGDETPAETALREVREETGLRLWAGRLSWGRAYTQERVTNWFFRAEISEREAEGLRLGDEGQALWLMELENYFAAADAIQHMKARVRAALAAG